MAERVDIDTLDIDDMHVVWPRAGRARCPQDVHHCRGPPVRGGPRTGAHCRA